MRKFWSEKERQVLVDKFSYCEPREIMADLPGRGWPEIQAKANRLGLRRAKIRRHRRFWTREEVDLLRERYPLMTKGELIEAFRGRSLAAIYAQAQRFNLKRSVGGPVWKKREEIILRNLVEQGGTRIEIECEFRDKTWKQIVKKMQRLGLSNGRDLKKKSSWLKKPAPKEKDLPAEA